MVCFIFKYTYIFRATRPKGNVPVVDEGHVHTRYCTTPAHRKQYVFMYRILSPVYIISI